MRPVSHVEKCVATLVAPEAGSPPHAAKVFVPIAAGKVDHWRILFSYILISFAPERPAAGPGE